MIRSEEYKGCTLELHRDEDPENPRTAWDNATQMICFHGRYKLGDEDHGFRQDEYKGWDDLEETLNIDSAAVLPLFLYDHSGITINTTGFSCPWDSGQVGFIRVSREVANREWPDADEKTLNSYMISDVETYDKYLRGEVYGFVVKDGSGEEIGSCWGFYGEDDAIADAKSTADYMWNQKHELFTQAGVEVEARSTGSFQTV